MASIDIEPGKLKKADLFTPALLLDLDLFEKNLKTLTDHCKQAGVGFRPHAKTHKCPEIAKRQVAVGALGVSVATVPEAEAMVAAGLKGVLLTSPIMERRKINRMVELAKTGGAMLSIGSIEQLTLLADAAESSQTKVDILVDVDVGDKRTGVEPGRPALELAQAGAKCKCLRIRGVQAYAGHAAHVTGFENRQKVSQRSMAKAVETKELLSKSGFDVPILSGGSTGTYNIDSGIKGMTELQVGSYIFMDQDYVRIGGKSGKVYTDFERSLTVLTTVVSAAHSDRVTVDAGGKSFAKDVRFPPEAKGWEGLNYDHGGDEFGVLFAEGGKLPKLGDRLEFYVPHCDPTVNCYDRIYAVRGDAVEGVWPVAARKEAADLHR